MNNHTVRSQNTIKYKQGYGGFPCSPLYDSPEQNVPLSMNSAVIVSKQHTSILFTGFESKCKASCKCTITSRQEYLFLKKGLMPLVFDPPCKAEYSLLFASLLCCSRNSSIWLTNPIKDRDSQDAFCLSQEKQLLLNWLTSVRRGYGAGLDNGYSDRSQAQNSNPNLVRILNCRQFL